MKTRVELMQEKIVQCLQEDFYVTDGELVAKEIDPYWLSPNDVAQPVQQKLGVLVTDRDYPNWREFIKVFCRAACRQGVKL